MGVIRLPPHIYSVPLLALLRFHLTYVFFTLLFWLPGTLVKPLLPSYTVLYLAFLPILPTPAALTLPLPPPYPTTTHYLFGYAAAGGISLLLLMFLVPTFTCLNFCSHCGGVSPSGEAVDLLYL